MPSAGCAPSTRAARNGDRSQLLTQAELASVGSGSLHEAIARFRPDLLHQRGPASTVARASGGPLLIVDGVRLGSSSMLHQIAAREVAVVRHLSAWDAATRYGSGASEGVIEVTTKR